jgi:hypothetical protein
MAQLELLCKLSHDCYGLLYNLVFTLKYIRRFCHLALQIQSSRTLYL